MHDYADMIVFMILEIRHLRLIQAIAREGGVTKASQQLHLTQSALSHQLREIESLLEAPLFMRLKKKMVLTQEGERLLQTADSVLPQLQQTEETIRRIARGETGLLRISTQCNTCYHWLPAMMKTFDRSFPGIEIRIVVNETSRSIEALLEGKIDLAITFSKFPDRNLFHYPIFEDELLALMRPDHPLASRQYLNPADFQEQSLIVYSIPLETSYIFKKFLQPSGVMPKKIYPVMLTEAILEMVEAGIGVSVMARWAALPYLKSGKLRGVPLGKRGMRRQWYAVTIKSPTSPPYLEEFAKLLSENAYPAVYQGAQALAGIRFRRL